MLAKIKNYFTRRKVLKGLIRTYKQQVIVQEIENDWISRCIIERKQEGRRNELIQGQQKLKELELLLKFVKTIK